MSVLTCTDDWHLVRFTDDFVILDLFNDVADDIRLTGQAVAGLAGLG